MNLSQKCQYAVRAVLELSKRYGRGAVSAGEIAASQAIPQRFLEIILNELKPTGLIDSRRGVQGGYYLTCPPDQITVGRVIRLVEGPLDIVRCAADQESRCCPLKDQCSLVALWHQAREALEQVYDSTTFKDLADRERDLERQTALDYCI
ncbi:MAG: Rrf2 family transcriptional regulator [Phycisphaerales bacterium]|nr:Rrf2 family transcriptional regulator [Phycisphaerales bacterium]